MIIATQTFFKISEQKVYCIGEKASFSKEDEKSLVDRGSAEYVVQENKKKKVTIKTK